MNVINNPSISEWSSLLKRPTSSYNDIEPIVQEIFDHIKTRGDDAVRDYTQKFDKAPLTEIAASTEEIQKAQSQVSTALKDAIALAKKNIETFHKAQIQQPSKIITEQGVECWQEYKSIEKVGFYIPGGTAPLFSTILMLAIPATIAGCENIILCTPPNQQGKIAAEILYTASLCGITQIFKVGGIQAIGAMTFGTESIPSVYKIFGPGNQYVTVAKQLATQHGVAIDMPAGPSELLVMADQSADPSFVASDLLSQAEHGVDSQVLLVTTSQTLINDVQQELTKQLEVIPRKTIAQQAISHSKMILINDFETALKLINQYAPEHFIINTTDNDFFVNGITNAGSVFIGNYTPESAGDYASGTNHTLPTNGFARNYSGVNTASFMKVITFQSISSEGLQKIGPAIELMAAAEQLQAHKNAVTLRLNSLKK